MKLKVKILKTAAVTGRSVVLCDEDGRMLPGQQRTVLNCPHDDIPRITVEFVVDGDSVQLVGSD